MSNINYFFTKLILSFLSVALLTGCVKSKNSTANQATSQKVVEVAILLPIFGEENKLYKELNSMVKMGLADGAKTKFRVTTYDASNKDTMRESLEKIATQNTDVIIGPVFSEATEEVAAKFKNRNTVIITLSNNPVLAEKNVFVFGHAPMKQQEFLLDQLLSNNYINFIAMLPAGRYSKTVSSIFKQMIAEKNATLVRVEYYEDNEEDIARVTKIVSDAVDNLNEMDQNLTQPVVLLADDANTLQKAFAYMSNYKLDKKSLIAGDSRINISSAEKLDVLFTGSANINNPSVISRSGKLGINHLGFMHQLAYDAGKIVSEAIGQEYDYSSFIDKLQNIHFEGISGKISFIDSIAQRQYEVIKKTNGIMKEFIKRPELTEEQTLQNQVKQLN